MVAGQQAIEPEYLSDFEADIEEIARQGQGLSDSDPDPASMLDFVHYQAVHEAGHAVIASHLGILFDTVRVIYKAEVDVIPIGNPEQVTAEDRRKRLLGYAAGAAAEHVVFGRRREPGCRKDRHGHQRWGGTDFDGDAAEVREYNWFSKPVLLKIASLLEDRHALSHRDVRQALNIPIRWTDYGRWLADFWSKPR